MNQTDIIGWLLVVLFACVTVVAVLATIGFVYEHWPRTREKS